MESWNCCLTYKQKKINPTICSSFQWFQDEEQAHKICILALVSKTKKKKKGRWLKSICKLWNSVPLNVLTPLDFLFWIAIFRPV